jgi:FkbM family methyltransferase
VLVEPMPYLFNRLVANYAGVPGLAFERRAIAESGGRRMFYYLRQSEDTLPSWHDQLGSFHRDMIRKHKDHIPNIEDYIVEMLADCVSFQTLVKEHQMSSIDVVLIDTEGYDLQILKQIDFERFSPQLVMYEQKHLSAEDERAAETLLSGRDYVRSQSGRQQHRRAQCRPMNSADVELSVAGATRRSAACRSRPRRSCDRLLPAPTRRRRVRR